MSLISVSYQVYNRGRGENNGRSKPLTGSENYPLLG